MRSSAAGLTWRLLLLFALHLPFMGADSCSSSRDADGDGTSEEEGDCDDNDAQTYPGAPELCDAKDNDCNGIPDDLEVHAYYRDADGDGFGNALTAASYSGCDAIPADFVASGADCDDVDPLVYPATTPDGTASDSDCDGEVDTLVRYAGLDWLQTDGRKAIEVPLVEPKDIEPDGTGGFYLIADDAVRHVDAGGVITTFAGTGTRGHTGDGGPATEAQLSYPNGLALDRQGNLFISCNACIRRVDIAGIITTVAGNAAEEAGPAIDGVQATRSYMGPEAVAVDDAGQLFIADWFNNRIRMVRTDGIIVTVAGDGEEISAGDGGPATEASLDSPKGVAVTREGEIYIGEDGPVDLVRKVSLDGTIQTVAGGENTGLYEGPGTDVWLVAVRELGIDAADNVYITTHDRIMRMKADGWVDTVVGGGDVPSGSDGIATSVSLSWAEGVAVDTAGQIYIAERDPGRGRVVDTTGYARVRAGNGGFSGDGGAATDATLWAPEAIAAGPEGALYIADTENNRIRRVDAGGFISTIALAGSDGSLTGLAVDPGGTVYYSDSWSHLIRKVAPDGTVSTFAGNGATDCGGDGGPATAASICFPRGLTLDRSGNLYVADAGANRVRRIGTDGVLVSVAGTGSQGYSGDGGPATAAQLYSPLAVAVDDSGTLFISDGGNGCIRRVDASGRISTYAGVPGANLPLEDGPALSEGIEAAYGLALDAAGVLYVADAGYEVIRAIFPDGVIRTIAGTGTSSEDDMPGPARTTRLHYPGGVANDGAGNVFIADTAANTVWRLSR